MEAKKILFTEHDRIRTYEDGRFGEPTGSELKTLPNGTIVPLSLLNVHTLKLSDRLSGEELRLQVEIRMFEEGNLNSEEEYTIDYIRHEVASDDSVLVEVFALSHAKAEEYYRETLSKTGAIDKIVPGFLVYESLYPRIGAKNDLFVYWGEEEAYAAIYREGKYIAHRSIETLASIAVDLGLELPKLKTFLSQKGVHEENYLPEELNKYILLQDKIAKNVERIVHTINHKRGLFGLEGIDALYLDFEGNTIPGIEGIFYAYGMNGVSVSPVLRSDTTARDIHDAVCADYLAFSANAFNLSPYPRKAPWYRRESGKFLGLAALAAGIVLTASITTAWMISQEQSQSESLQQRYDAVRKETAALSAKLKENRAQLAKQQDETKRVKEEIALYHGAEDTADLIRNMHASREQLLLDTTAELGRYRLGAMLMEQNGSKEMKVLVVSDYKKRDDIAKLMNGMYARGYQNVETREIKLDNDMYNSLVKVTR